MKVGALTYTGPQTGVKHACPKYSSVLKG